MPNEHHLLNSALSTLKRWCVYLVAATSIFIIIGCAIYPLWWFGSFWKSGYRRLYNYYDVVNEFRRIPLTASMVLISVLIIIVMVYRNWRKKIKLLADRHAFIAICISIFIPVIAANLVYAGQSRNWKSFEAAESVLIAANNFISVLDESSRVNFDAPVTFYFIDDKYVNDLFDQIEPDFVETSRADTVLKKQGVNATVEAGIAGGIVESKTELETKREYQAAKASAQRHCLQLIQHCLKAKRAAIFVDETRLVLLLFTEEMTKILAIQRKLIREPLNESFNDRYMDNLNQVTKIKKVAEEDAHSIMSSPPEFVVATGPFNIIAENEGMRTYEGNYTRISNSAISIRFAISSKNIIPLGVRTAQTELRLFGHVESINYSHSEILTIRPIAVF